MRKQTDIISVLRLEILTIKNRKVIKYFQSRFLTIHKLVDEEGK